MQKTKKYLVKARIVMEKIFYTKIVKQILSFSRIGLNTISGKADAGISIDCLYRNKPRGLYSIGKVIDRILLRLPAVKATQKKRDIIIKIIQNEFENNKYLKTKTKILDLASGPARYLIDFLENCSYKKDDVEILCLDSDRTSINFGKIIASDKPIRFVKANVFKLGTLRKFSEKIGWKPNMVLCTGFFEMQSDECVMGFLKEIYNFMEHGGLFIFTSQLDNPSKKLMKKIGKTRHGNSWKMHFREPQTLRKWLIDRGFRDVIISCDYWGMYEFCTGRKNWKGSA